MPAHGLNAVVFSHLPFEDLGSLEPELLRRGFEIETIDVTTARFPLSAAEQCDLLIVMGGPIGVYDSVDYPFLSCEIDAIRHRLAARKPTLGICLGAQLISAALGARVYPGSNGPEIGWFPILPADPSPTPDWFAPLCTENLRMFHWHGDTFDLPPGAQHLAWTATYENQAFAIGNYALALQFHPEVTASGLERWYVGHTCELRQKRISIPQLRADAHLYAPALLQAASQFWKLWLDYIL
ncbi:MAG TPA: glutamine amidotransferase [Terracidiphilus sp.]|jgi:GMP synthase (glutamine-hydrolysing)